MDDIGHLSPGAAADFVVLDRHLRVQTVTVDGTPVD